MSQHGVRDSQGAQGGRRLGSQGSLTSPPSAYTLSLNLPFCRLESNLSGPGMGKELKK